MGRSKHSTVEKLSDPITDREFESVAAHSGFPLDVVQRVLTGSATLSHASAASLRKSLHKDDRALVRSRVSKPTVELSEPAQRYGLPPENYELVVKPVVDVKPGDLLSVNDRSAIGWLRVIDDWHDTQTRKHEIIIPTEHGNVISAKSRLVRVAVQAYGDSQ